MEASFLSAALVHPAALLLLVLVVFTAVYLGAQSGPPKRRISRSRLLSGFGAVLVVALVIAAVVSYVPPSEAQRFGVGSENYWEALWREFLVLAVLVAYFSLIGCAVVGVPITLQLAKCGLATVPFVVVVSVLVTLVVLLPIELGSSVRPARLVQHLFIFVGSHALLALGFAVGARLPWRRKGVLRGEA